MLHVVEAVVLEETELGDDTELVVYALAEVVAYGLLVLADILDDLLGFGGREDAQVSRADAEVRTDAYAGDTHEDAVGLTCLTLENLC